MTVVLWGIPAALLLAGALMWRDRRALSARGVDTSARVEACEWERMGWLKSRIRRGGSGYYSCTYTYQPSGSGRVYDGYFQSASRWETGRAVSIRYLPEQPAISAWAGDLRHTLAAPLGVMGLGAALLGWRLWRAVRPPGA